MVFAVNPEDFGIFQSRATGAKTSSIPTPTDNTTSVPPLAGQPPPTMGTDGPATMTVTESGKVETITYSSFPGSAAPTSGVSADHLVEVSAANQLSFVPSHLTAQVGDTITFQFARGNHSVVRSTFENPCQSLASTGLAGFDSGL